MIALLYCPLDLGCGECNVISLYVLCFSVNGSVWFVCLTAFVKNLIVGLLFFALLMFFLCVILYTM